MIWEVNLFIVWFSMKISFFISAAVNWFSCLSALISLLTNLIMSLSSVCWETAKSCFFNLTVSQSILQSAMINSFFMMLTDSVLILQLTTVRLHQMTVFRRWIKTSVKSQSFLSVAVIWSFDLIILKSLINSASRLSSQDSMNTNSCLISFMSLSWLSTWGLFSMSAENAVFSNLFKSCSQFSHFCSWCNLISSSAITILYMSSVRWLKFRLFCFVIKSAFNFSKFSSECTELISADWPFLISLIILSAYIIVYLTFSQSDLLFSTAISDLSRS